MSLLDKFAVVEIKVDARISEQDKQFCERQQAAYTAALHGFQELIFSGRICCWQSAALMRWLPARFGFRSVWITRRQMWMKCCVSFQDL